MSGYNGKLKKLALMLTDILMVSGSLYLALVLRFEGKIPLEQMFVLEHLLLPVTFINLGIFYLSGLYRRLWRYASVDELLAIFFVVWIGVLGSYLYGLVTGWLFPRSVFVIFLCLLLLLLGGSRFILRVLADYLHFLGKTGDSPGNTAVLIIGAGDAGAMVAKEYKKHQAQQGVRVLGFVDDNLSKQGKVIQGFPVLGTRQDLRRIVDERGVREIVIAMPSVPYHKLREVVELCKGLPVKIKTVPGVYEILEGKVSLQHLKEVGIEDLLRRPPVEGDMKEISSYLSGKAVMVTGAGGSIGAELCRQLARLEPQKIVLLDQSENDLFAIEQELQRDHPGLEFYSLVRDIKDRAALAQVFRKLSPHVVFHAAAYKHVPLMEANPEEAVKNNVLGSKNLLDLAVCCGVEHFVVISTDKAVKPSNVMGATKRVVEIYMQHQARQNGVAGGDGVGIGAGVRDEEDGGDGVWGGVVSNVVAAAAAAAAGVDGMGVGAGYEASVGGGAGISYSAGDEHGASPGGGNGGGGGGGGNGAVAGAFCAVRFGNVLGSRGSVVPIFREQIAAGGPVTVTHPEMTRYFMTIPEAVQLVIQAGAFGKEGEIFVLDMGEPIRVLDLARDMITLSGLQPEKDIEIKFTGVRPGEKLTEELFSDKENFTLTKHRRIFMAPDILRSEKERDTELRDLGELLGVDLQVLLGFRKAAGTAVQERDLRSAAAARAEWETGVQAPPGLPELPKKWEPRERKSGNTQRERLELRESYPLIPAPAAKTELPVSR